MLAGERVLGLHHAGARGKWWETRLRKAAKLLTSSAQQVGAPELLSETRRYLFPGVQAVLLQPRRPCSDVSYLVKSRPVSFLRRAAAFSVLP